MIGHPHDDLEAFALGSLDEAAALRVLSHADACPTCAVLLADAMNAVAALEPPGERRVARALSIDGPSTGSSAADQNMMASLPRWGFGLAAAAVIAALLIWNLDLRTNMPTVPIASLVHSHFIHHVLHGTTGNAKVIQALDGSWLYVLGDGLKPHAGYRLWENERGSSHEAGSFQTDGQGRATAYFEQPPVTISGFVVAPLGADPRSADALRWP